MLSVKISSVKPFSKCWFHGIKSGDELLSVDGKEVTDILDYDFYLSFPPVVLNFRTASGKLIDIPFKNDDTGLKFRTYLMDQQHHCKNGCIFCFIDQLPKGMRESLYFKDDDSRLSFLFGNYVTLTNITEHEVDRIIRMHISPINISVHTMNPELRVKMMKNKNAGKCLSIIKRLSDAGIKMNAQLVLCPGINDGDELRYSIEELSKYMPTVQSIACVPVGLTKYRDGLFPMQPYTKKTAGEVIDIIEEYSEKFKKQYGVRVCYPSDEFFLKAERPMPSEEYYDDYPQIDNGVGLWTSLRDEFFYELSVCEKAPTHKSVTVITGVAAYPLIKELCDAAQEIAADTAYLAHDYPRVVVYRRLGGEIRKAMREETAADAATLDRFERTNPQNFHTWKLLGEYYRSQGDDLRAAQCFDKALQSGIPRTDEREAVERLKSECKP